MGHRATLRTSWRDGWGATGGARVHFPDWTRIRKRHWRGNNNRKPAPWWHSKSNRRGGAARTRMARHRFGADDAITANSATTRRPSRIRRRQHTDASPRRCERAGINEALTGSRLGSIRTDMKRRSRAALPAADLRWLAGRDSGEAPIDLFGVRRTIPDQFDRELLEPPVVESAASNLPLES